MNQNPRGIWKRRRKVGEQSKDVRLLRSLIGYAAFDAVTDLYGEGHVRSVAKAVSRRYEKIKKSRADRKARETKKLLELGFSAAEIPGIRTDLKTFGRSSLFETTTHRDFRRLKNGRINMTTVTRKRRWNKAERKFDYLSTKKTETITNQEKNRYISSERYAKKVKQMATTLGVTPAEARHVLRVVRLQSARRIQKIKGAKWFKELKKKYPKRARAYTIKREQTTNEILLFRLLGIESPTIREFYNYENFEGIE